MEYLEIEWNKILTLVKCIGKTLLLFFMIH